MFVVIGGGIAGVTCTEQLAELLPNEQIVIVSASPLVKACINVKKISKVMEDFDVEEKSASYLEANYQNVKVIYDKATSLNSETHELFLSNGDILKYKKICLCIGGTPKLLADNPYVIGIRDTQTISEFQEKLQDSKRIVVVGNGGIATELTYEIENCEVIWAIRHASIGATFFDAGAAEFFLPHLTENKEKVETDYLRRVKYSISNESSASNQTTGSALGPDWSANQNLKAKNDVKNIRIEYKCEVKRIISNEEVIKNNIEVARLSENESLEEWPIFVQLTNDKVYGCNFVVSATGVVPNTDIAVSPQELKISPEDGGIEVNNQMITSCIDVYAAGDCCTATWEKTKTWFQMRLWTQARQMGYYAANCIYTHLSNQDNIPEICFDLFTHVTKFFGYKVILLGLYNCQGLGEDCELLLRMTKRKEYIKVVLQNHRMVGAILIGETDLEETFENLILNQLDLSSYGEDLLNPDVDIEDYFD